MSDYIVYFYPKYIIGTAPQSIPSGKILLTLVQEDELQILDSGKQICVQNTGSFFPPKSNNNPRGTELPSDYPITGNGLPDNTKVIGYNYGPSVPLGIYTDCLILTLSNPLNILLSDGNFYVPPPPPTPPPPTIKPNSTPNPNPGPTTPGPTLYSIFNPGNLPTQPPVFTTQPQRQTQPPYQRSSNPLIAFFEDIGLFFSNLFSR
jgi:hypothetical protein